mgnify:CR=1 FL=1
MNPWFLIVLLHNAETDRYHPCYYYQSPLPSSGGTEGPVRYRSKGHHTEGFATEAEGWEGCKELRQGIIDSPLMDTGKDDCEVELEEDIHRASWSPGEVPAHQLYRDRRTEEAEDA